MTNRIRNLFLLFLLALLAVSLSCSTATKTPPAGKPGAPAAQAAVEEKIPLDPLVTYGKLANGLTYYIRPNKKPAGRAELRLVVNAGSLQEDDDQRGLAHLVEHMAFAGTTHFKKQELVDYLEKIGMRYGPDINASTDFDETVYQLQIPTDSADTVSTAFQILEDWAHNLSFDPSQIDRERKVVIEEWRLGRGASQRIRDQEIPVLFYGSRYAQRITIGDKHVLETASNDTIRRFYNDWYRPDLIAVVAVGDFDPKQIEQLVKTHFSQLAMPKSPRRRMNYPIPDHEQTLFSIATDPEATNITVMTGYKRPPVRDVTVKELREYLVDMVYHSMMNSRLDELRTRSDPPFVFAFAGDTDLGRTKSMYQLSARVNNGGVQRGLETLVVEARRVDQFGFTRTEFERTKTDMFRMIEQMYAERDKEESAAIISDYIDNYLEDDAAPGTAYIYNFFKDNLPGITLEEVNARAHQWISKNDRVVLTSGPDKPEAGIPKQEALLSVFDQASKAPLTAWVDVVRNEPLVPSKPQPGRIEKEESIPELNVTRWALSNGAMVLLKPTTFKNDQIVLSGTRWGGTSLASDQDYLSAAFSDSIVQAMGLGNFSRVELDKALSGKIASIDTSISELSEDISGTASPKDVETMFQLLYLNFTGVRKDEQAFGAFMARQKAMIQNRTQSPAFLFGRKFAEVLYKGHPRRMPIEVEQLNEINLDRAIAFYKERFSDAGGFLFVIVGNFDPKTIRPVVETWIGGLPSMGKKETWRDIGLQFPDGVSKFEMRKGIEPRTAVRIDFVGNAEWSDFNEHMMTSLSDTMKIKLREVLREDLGGVYGVNAGGILSRYPQCRFRFSISFSCDPGRVDSLIAATFDAINSMKTTGPADDLIVKVKEGQIRERETDLEDNRFWRESLEYYETNGLDPRKILAYKDLVNAVTKDSMESSARQFLDTSHYVQGVLYPETK